MIACERCLLSDRASLWENLSFCIFENKNADQLRSNCAADQRICFLAIRIVQSLYYLNPKFQASSYRLWLYRSVYVRPGRKSRRPVFSQRGSDTYCHVVSFELNRRTEYPKGSFQILTGSRDLETSPSTHAR